MVIGCFGDRCTLTKREGATNERATLCKRFPSLLFDILDKFWLHCSLEQSIAEETDGITDQKDKHCHRSSEGLYHVNAHPSRINE